MTNNTLIEAMADAIHDQGCTDATPEHYAQAALDAIAAKGFVVMPVEPTEAMIDRFVSRALNVTVQGDGEWSKYAREQYKAMIEAARQE